MRYTRGRRPVSGSRLVIVPLNQLSTSPHHAESKNVDDGQQESVVENWYSEDRSRPRAVDDHSCRVGRRGGRVEGEV